MYRTNDPSVLWCPPRPDIPTLSSGPYDVAMTKKKLYGFPDIVGWILSEWRARAVLPFVVGNLMDLACGDNRLVKKYGEGVGVDIVKYQDVDVVVHDLANLPFRNHEFDTVAILAALNYFDNPGAVLREVSRVLKPDGMVLLTFLNKKTSRIWHSFWEKESTPRPAFSEAELTGCLKIAKMILVQKRVFMFGLNTIYFIKRT